MHNFAPCVGTLTMNRNIPILYLAVTSPDHFSLSFCYLPVTIPLCAYRYARLLCALGIARCMGCGHARTPGDTSGVLGLGLAVGPGRVLFVVSDEYFRRTLSIR